MRDSGARHTSRVLRDAESTTFESRSAWLRWLADRIAAARPVLAAIRIQAAETDRAGIIDLTDAAAQAVAKGRGDLEHLARELEDAARTHQRGDNLARSSLFRRRHDSPHLTEATPTGAQVRALIADVADDLPGQARTRCHARIARATSSELSVLTDLVAAGLTHEQLIRLLEGGHLLIPGHHQLERWATLEGVKPRTSSHYHPHVERSGRGPSWATRLRSRVGDAHAKPMYGQQYGLKGKFLHEALFGPGPHDTTFIQLERAAPSKLRLVEHITNWIEYRLTRRNQGPYGSTVVTDSDPLRVPLPPSTLRDAVTHLERLETVIVEVGGDLAAEGQVEPIVWRGPPGSGFDVAVRAAAIDLGHAANAVHALLDAVTADSVLADKGLPDDSAGLTQT